MGAIREKMDRDMTIRGYAEKTRQMYLFHAKQYVKYHRKAPDRLTIEEVNQYQAYLIREKKVSWTYFNQAVQALRFLYRTTLKRNWDIAMMPYHKKGKTVPTVLSPAEVAALFDELTLPKHRAIAMALYSSGLRLNEVRTLRLQDIDAERMVIRVCEGKGNRERYVMLAARLLEELRAHWRTAKVKPRTWLFPGTDPDVPLCDRTIQKLISTAAVRAGLSKRVTPHTLRHSFATHLLESGINIRIIQTLLGHRSLNATMIYTHVAKNGPVETRSPLDDLKKEADTAGS